MIALVLTDVPDEGESRRQAADFYNSAGDKWRVVAAVALMAVAALLFGVFAAAVVDRLRTFARHLAGIAAAAFVALYLGAAAMFVAPTFTLALDPEGADAVDRQFVDFARGLSTVGDAFLLVASMFGAAAFVGALAWSAPLPRWLAWSGRVVSVACLFGVFFLPLLLFALWILLLGVSSVRGAESGHN